MSASSNTNTANDFDTKLESDEEMARQDFLDTIYIPAEPHVKWSTCNECQQLNMSFRWCQSCNARHFQQEFSTWTSGDRKIDFFLRNTQLYAPKSTLVRRLISYSSFTNVKKIGAGGYGTVFSAEWTDELPIEYWDFNTKNWVRGDQKKMVALKSFDGPNTKEPIEDLLNEAKMLQRMAMKINPGNFFGITRDPSGGEYFLVLSFAGHGDIRTYLKTKETTWKEKLTIVWEIALELNFLHKTGLIHRDLHPGNILHFGGIKRIADLGLSIHKSKVDQCDEVFGVMPFIAPELFAGGKYSQESDVYAFGMLMWEISSNKPPFEKVAHTSALGLSLCRGQRPKPVEDTPSFYREVMEKCWNTNPKERPTSQELFELVRGWLSPKTWSSAMKEEMDRAEEIRRKKPALEETRHPDAIYTSRKMPDITQLLTESFQIDTSSISQIYSELPTSPTIGDYLLDEF